MAKWVVSCGSTCLPKSRTATSCSFWGGLENRLHLAVPNYVIGTSKIFENFGVAISRFAHTCARGGGGATLLLPKPMCGPQGRRSGGRYTDVNHDHSALNRQVWEGDSFKLWIFNDFLQTVRGLTELSEHGRWRWRRLPPRFWNLTFSCYISSKKTFFLSYNREKWNSSTFGYNLEKSAIVPPWKNPLLLPSRLEKSAIVPPRKNPPDAHTSACGQHKWLYRKTPQRCWASHS